MNRNTLLLTLLLFLFGSFALSAQPQKMRNGKQRIIEYLELNENQRGKIESMRQEHQDQMLQLISLLKIKKAELDAALLKEDSKEVQNLVNEINELRGAGFSNKIQHQLAIKSLLNEDQKRKFDQMILTRNRMNKLRKPQQARPHPGEVQPRGNRPFQGGN